MEGRWCLVNIKLYPPLYHWYNLLLCFGRGWCCHNSCPIPLYDMFYLNQWIWLMIRLPLGSGPPLLMFSFIYRSYFVWWFVFHPSFEIRCLVSHLACELFRWNELGLLIFIFVFLLVCVLDIDILGPSYFEVVVMALLQYLFDQISLLTHPTGVSSTLRSDDSSVPTLCVCKKLRL